MSFSVKQTIAVSDEPVEESKDINYLLKKYNSSLKSSKTKPNVKMVQKPKPSQGSSQGMSIKTVPGTHSDFL